MNTFIADDTHVRIGGRSIFENGIRYLSYTNSFMEFEFTGTRASVKLISDLTPPEDIYRAYAAVFINGEYSHRIKLDRPEEEFVLWESENPEKIRLRLMKVSEAAFAKMGIASITIDGELHPAPAPEYERRIEFIGDSITCGYGVDGIWNKDVFSTETENPLKGYAYKTALKCRAEFQYVSWSGIGLMSCYVDENAEKPLNDWLMQDLYVYTDSPLEKSQGKASHDEHRKYDFSFKPQAIVLNIGTNDHSWTKDIKERQEEYAEIYFDFLKEIRSHNPQAYIFCAYGVMGNVLANVQREQTERFKTECDDRICYIELPVQLESDGIGADWHPSEITHEKMSLILADKLNAYFDSIGL